MNPYQHRVLLVCIGAGATALALFAFSGAWCLMVTSCGLEGEACDASFWEVFGLASGSMVCFLMINPIRKHFERRSSSRQFDAPYSFNRPTPPPPAPTNSYVQANGSDCLCEPQQPSCSQEPGNRWRALYEQMSPEEQKEFKVMMQQLCTRGEKQTERAEIRSAENGE